MLGPFLNTPRQQFGAKSGRSVHSPRQIELRRSWDNPRLVGNIMEWEIIIHNDRKYIEIITRGFLDKDSSMDMAKTIAETMRSHRFTKALIDHRNISDVSGNVVDVYERPKLFRIIGVVLRVRIAEIIHPDHSRHFTFLETVMRNQGYKFSIFYERQPALEWLLDQ